MRQKIDVQLYNAIMSQPEALPHRFYRKALRTYVTNMSAEDRQRILDRADEIMQMEAEWLELNEAVLCRLGFNEQEVMMLRDKRQDSPGMRHVIRTKVIEIYGERFAREGMR